MLLLQYSIFREKKNQEITLQKLYDHTKIMKKITADVQY